MSLLLGHPTGDLGARSDAQLAHDAVDLRLDRIATSSMTGQPVTLMTANIPGP